MNKTTIFIIFAANFMPHLKSASDNLITFSQGNSSPQSRPWTPTLAPIVESPLENDDIDDKTFTAKFFGRTIEYKGPISIVLLNLELDAIYENCNPDNIKKSKIDFINIAQELVTQFKSITIIEAPQWLTKKQIIDKLINRVIQKTKAFNIRYMFYTISSAN